jgi:hypothetical protein
VTNPDVVKNDGVEGAFVIVTFNLTPIWHANGFLGSEISSQIEADLMQGMFWRTSAPGAMLEAYKHQLSHWTTFRLDHQQTTDDEHLLAFGFLAIQP